MFILPALEGRGNEVDERPGKGSPSPSSDIYILPLQVPSEPLTLEAGWTGGFWPLQKGQGASRGDECQPLDLRLHVVRLVLPRNPGGNSLQSRRRSLPSSHPAILQNNYLTSFSLLNFRLGHRRG